LCWWTTRNDIGEHDPQGVDSELGARGFGPRHRPLPSLHHVTHSHTLSKDLLCCRLHPTASLSSARPVFLFHPDLPSSIFSSRRFGVTCLLLAGHDLVNPERPHLLARYSHYQRETHRLPSPERLSRSSINLPIPALRALTDERDLNSTFLLISLRTIS
jgi:hypothetical protein